MDIIDRKLVQRKGRACTEVLIRWKGESVEEAFWEDWQELQSRFPEFVESIHP